jgi:hypothetical protein
MAREFEVTPERMIDEIRESGGKPAGKLKPEEVFRRALKEYSRLERERKHSEPESGVHNFLSGWLRMTEYKHLVESLGDGLEELTFPGGIQPKDRPYRELLVKVFGIRSSLSVAIGHRWDKYLLSLADRPEENLPVSGEALFSEFTMGCIEMVRSSVCPPWPATARAYVEYVLQKDLTLDHLAVLRPTFGIGGVLKQPMKEIAQNLGVPVYIARARCDRALKMLRYHQYARELRRLVKPVPLTVIVPGQDPRLALLSESVDVLELMVRASNALFNANIFYIGEIVQYKEAELLKRHNFGRKSLQNLVEVLAEYGDERDILLALGMTFEPDFKAELDQRLEELRRSRPPAKIPLPFSSR